MHRTMQAFVDPQPVEVVPRPTSWVFGLLALPLGICLSFVTTVLPFLLSKAQVPVGHIARLTSFITLPSLFCFLWAPLADTALRRRTWLVIAATSAAACFSTVLLVIGTNLPIIGALGFGGVSAASMLLATCGGLMVTTVSAAEQSQASAWYEGGKLGGGALGAGLLLWLTEHTQPVYVALIASALIITPSLAAFSIAEKSPVRASAFRHRIVEIRKGITALSPLPRQKWSIILLASPTGASAAMALLPAIAKYYGVNATGIIWMNGIGGGLLLVLGALCGVLIPGSWNRRVTYIAAGMTNALAAMILVVGNQPRVYFLGTGLYLFTAGFCWARYAALLAEVVGPDSRGASTRYSVLAAVGNLPLAYMVWFDGIGFQHAGGRGLLSIDAAGNALVLLASTLLMLYRSLGARKKRS